jgi:hypothetical protein
MPQTICFQLQGHKICIDIPLLVQKPFHKPPPPNFPEIELAATVLELVEFVGPSVPESKLAKELHGAATNFMQGVQKQLPQGVELKM